MHTLMKERSSLLVEGPIASWRLYTLFLVTKQIETMQCFKYAEND